MDEALQDRRLEKIAQYIRTSNKYTSLKESQFKRSIATYEFLNALSLGTGKTTWELIRICIQSFTGKVAYLITLEETPLIKFRLSQGCMLETLERAGMSECIELYKPENVLVSSYCDCQEISRSWSTEVQLSVEYIQHLFEPSEIDRSRIIISHNLMKIIQRHIR